MGKQKTDKEIAEEVDLDATLVCTIMPEQWKLILMYKVRGIILQIAQAEGVQGVMEFIEKLQFYKRGCQEYILSPTWPKPEILTASPRS
jgi:hypothetical protein